MTGIQAAIRALGSQGRLARAVGVKQPAVSKWAKRGYVSETKVQDVARVAEVPVQELMAPRLRQLLGE